MQECNEGAITAFPHYSLRLYVPFVSLFTRSMTSRAHLFSHEGQAKAYGEFRPHYDKELYDAVYAYAGAPQLDRALDVATGAPLPQLPSMPIEPCSSYRGEHSAHWAVPPCLASQISVHM